MMDPNLNKVVEKYEGKVNLVKVDVDELQDLAMEYGVSCCRKKKIFRDLLPLSKS